MFECLYCFAFWICWPNDCSVMMLGQKLCSNITSYHCVSTKQPCDFPLKEQTGLLPSPSVSAAADKWTPHPSILATFAHSFKNFAGKLKSAQTIGCNQSVLDTRTSNVHGDPAKDRARVMLVPWKDVVLFRKRKTYKSAHLQDGYSYYRRLAKDAFK